MEYFLYTAVFILFVIGGYIFARQFLESGRENIYRSGRIEKIELIKVGEVWSPEVNIEYQFRYGSRMYQGEDYIRIDHLIQGHLLLEDRHGFPALFTDDGEFIGEEHIETYILKQTEEIPVVFSAFTLPGSRIYKGNKARKTLFQNISIEFPWSK